MKLQIPGPFKRGDLGPALSVRTVARSWRHRRWSYRGVNSLMKHNPTGGPASLLWFAVALTPSFSVDRASYNRDTARDFDQD
ncbi:hypothetical protein M440DRAFT_1397176 [Trichoderma longibrachiatum ATCC 18648]|uniref:Uncharacterized protein n=1 Tax=Trichoderma longibrachiatum ATCC 18648 TaxID=983965 RepID=A0A2T4CEE8_TRILO|nr:hypothetical protein M440DRAFT_1397176 [Trichoderma longibrachiatum ATCC 18648]